MTPPRISLSREVVEAAIDRLISAEEMANNELGSEESANRFGRATQALRLALSAPPEQPQPWQWIACAERSPERDEPVLVRIGLGKDGESSLLWIGRLISGDKWMSNPGNFYFRPTHWQPLPAPPPAQ